MWYEDYSFFGRQSRGYHGSEPRRRGRYGNAAWSLLIAADGALVVNVSYYGAVSYHLDPAYGSTKAGLDKLTFDMAQDFKPFKVAVVSIWPGRQPRREPSPPSRRCLGVTRYSKARKHLSFLVSLSLRCIRIRNRYRNREAWSSQPKQPWSTDPRISMASSLPAFENRRVLRARSRRVDLTTPRSTFPDGITKLQI